MLFGLLHAPPGKVRDAQQYELRARTDLRTAEQALDYADRMADLQPDAAPAAGLAGVPAAAPAPARRAARTSWTPCYALVHADGEVSLFEYCLGRLLRTQVAEALDPSRAWVPRRPPPRRRDVTPRR